ncbi:hypothetical protein [Saccharopolyspora phatthalungensis]|uniref:Uncharacterized protein n=1 Tax=Saccharopolyspora phatthalungensis TaxID=664693 RepID=A0A840Q3C4_9PSEU|nr:hypothetical protein [Saccharopolyspora phatthalungensis]MBB5154996.1 hypothetical protein [Saccharopolyspora phatthalungensis]
MGARLITPTPTGKHARLSLADRIHSALSRLLEAAREVPTTFAVLLVATACVGVALGLVLAGALL